MNQPKKQADYENEEIALRSGQLRGVNTAAPGTDLSACNRLVGFLHDSLEMIEGFLHRQGVHLSAVVFT